MDEGAALKRFADVIAIQTEIATAGLELQPVMELVVQRVQLLTGASGSVVELLQGENLVTPAASGTALPRLGRTSPVAHSLSGYCLRTGEVLLSNDAYSDSRVNPDGAKAIQARSIVVVPLRHRGSVVGVLKVYSESVRAFSDLDLQTLQLMSGVIAAAINDAALYTRAKDDAAKFFYEATHDALTGLANRALFLDRLEHELTVARRLRAVIAVFIIDLDDFKKINDTCGHQTGDLALVEVSRRLLSSLRDCDTIARLGGDEFGVHPIGVNDESSARASIERIVAAVENPFAVGESKIDLRLSTGFALYPRDGENAEALIAAADKHMYKVKQTRKIRG